MLWAYVSLGHWQPDLLPRLMGQLARLRAADLTAVQAVRLGEVDAGLLGMLPGVGEGQREGGLRYYLPAWVASLHSGSIKHPVVSNACSAPGLKDRS